MDKEHGRAISKTVTKSGYLVTAEDYQESAKLIVLFFHQMFNKMLHGFQMGINPQ
jgi:hypothetical protein